MSCGKPEVFHSKNITGTLRVRIPPVAGWTRLSKEGQDVTSRLREWSVREAPRMSVWNSYGDAKQARLVKLDS